MNPLYDVIHALESHGCGPVRNGQAKCPAHEDRSPSLSLGEGGDGRVLLKCHAGCETETIIKALNLGFSDLFPEKAKQPRSGNGQAGQARRRVAEYLYVDRYAEPLTRKVRTDPKGFYWDVPDGEGWRKAKKGEGNPGVIYRLPEVVEATAIHVCEGEKAADALTAAGYVATCAPTPSWTPELAEPLRGKHLWIWADRDEAGIKQAMAALKAIKPIAASVRVVQSAVEDEHADAFDHLQAGHPVEDAIDLEMEAAGDLAAILEDVAEFLARYVVFANEAQLVAVTLWVALTHVFDVFEAIIYLIITSPVKRSGKTRLLDVLELAVARAWRAVLPSEAVVFRKIDKIKPTLLLDEVDAIFGKKTAGEHEGLRAILNAGNRRGTMVSRCVGPSFELRDFDVTCPKALAGIGDPPDTVADRGVPIRLARRKRSERVERFRYAKASKVGHALRDRLAAWAESADLAGAEPEVHEGLNDRAADGWEPLLAIAEAAGGTWPQRARAAALLLHSDEDAEADTLGVRLLGDARKVLERQSTEVIFSASLLAGLREIEDAPWRDLREGKGLTLRGLADLLRPFGIKSGSVRIGPETAKGYRVADFYEAFERYLSPESASNPSHRHNPTESGTCADSEASQANAESEHPSQENASLFEDFGGV